MCAIHTKEVDGCSSPVCDAMIFEFIRLVEHGVSSSPRLDPRARAVHVVGPDLPKGPDGAQRVVGDGMVC